MDIFFALFTPQVQIIHENAINFYFYFFENGIFTLSTLSSSSIYKIVIAINTPTTMNNQFEALNVGEKYSGIEFFQTLGRTPASRSPLGDAPGPHYELLRVRSQGPPHSSEKKENFR